MKLVSTKIRAGFKPLLESASVQAAMMVLPPGEASSDSVEDEHSKAEQWVYVVSGGGKVKTRKRSVRVREGSLVLIEKNEAHQVVNTGKMSLVTLNFYAPPAYRADQQVRRSIKK